MHLINIRPHLKVMKKHDNTIYICFSSASSEPTSARSSRSSTLGSGLSSRSATTTESDGETELALDNVRVVARLVI